MNAEDYDAFGGAAHGSFIAETEKAVLIYSPTGDQDGPDKRPRIDEMEMLPLTGTMLISTYRLEYAGTC